MIIRALFLVFGLIDRSTEFWTGVIVAVCLATILFLTTRFSLRGFKFSDDDMKAAGLNHRRRRRLKARLKRKRRQKKMHF